jgi:hypothetical protein
MDIDYYLEGFKAGKRPHRGADGRLNMVEPEPQNRKTEERENGRTIEKVEVNPKQPQSPFYKRIFKKFLS